ncbi:hypothetical protein Desru_3138 [Desulforamulus ruminis DSM 2154]|uniref:Transposase n=1 Tax=Desulforamulus ruminis (strain ATCC 23193 / DSM 2154 / NCIMB 8452 / DL) TaxID=696281 RepID=F6DUV2_DESRL|nr:hypothetical protein Desru_3138 [Desulforamulus ruminis DSM 2154]
MILLQGKRVVMPRKERSSREVVGRLLASVRRD